MKKWISALLALTLTLGVLSFSAAESGGAIVLPETGVVMERTEALKNARGQIEVSELTGLAAFPEAMLAIVTYMAMTEQEYAPLREAVDRYNEAARAEQETGTPVPAPVINAAVTAQGTLGCRKDRPGRTSRTRSPRCSAWRRKASWPPGTSGKTRASTTT